MSERPGYRPCVGVALFNRAGLVFIGERREVAEEGDLSHPWQMPQGGIDAGETAEAAAARELYEETNVKSVAPLGAASAWLTYDVPGLPAAHAWGGRFRGQSQMWIALRFEGDDREIDVLNPGGGADHAEFRSWRWEELARVSRLVVPFKRRVYERVAEEFRPFSSSGMASAARRR